MLRLLKQSLAPPLATRAITLYWKSEYSKSRDAFRKALSWNPRITEEPLFAGYLGLAMHKLGEETDALPYLESAKTNLVAGDLKGLPSSSPEHQLLLEVSEILDGYVT